MSGARSIELLEVLFDINVTLKDIIMLNTKTVLIIKVRNCGIPCP